MNSWPTLGEWLQFSGVLALEVTIIFLVAKLLSTRVRSAQRLRGLWQITILAMLIAAAGELNGVRNLFHWPARKSTGTPAKFVVTFKEVPATDFFDNNVGATEFISEIEPISIPSKWRQRTAWPAMVWAVGFAFLVLRITIAQAYGIFFRMRSVRTTDAQVIERTERIARTLHIRRSVALLTSARAVAPFTFGVWRPVIVLPQRFAETFSPEQQDAALAHELAHVAGFDSVWRCFAQFTCALLWWHPFVWLAKRELDDASEVAADEASLLLADGPNHLAECLVTCAKEMRRPALASWLGMDGGGFRSALGKRVAHLLKFQSGASLSRPVPWWLRVVAPAFCALVLWVGITFVTKPHDATWRGSILGSAFAAAAETKSTAPPEASRIEVARLVQDGKLYYETGQLEAARTNLLEALRRDPTNRGALYYLDLVAARESSTTNRLTNPERQQIYEKLRRIRLKEWGPIDRLPLSEVVHALSDEARRLDPDHKGVNFIISPNASPNARSVDSAGLPVETNTPFDLNAVNVQINSELKNLTLEEALNVLCKVADKKIKYSVENLGVILSPGGAESVPLHTRFFRIDPKTFEEKLRAATKDVSGASPTNGLKNLPQRDGTSTASSNGISFLTEVNPAETVIPVVRSFFQAAGVDLAAPGKAVFYNDRLGVLMVRATLEDLDAIERTLRAANIELLKGLPPAAQTNASAPPRVLSDLPYMGKFFHADEAEAPVDSPALPLRRFNVDSNSVIRSLESLSQRLAVSHGAMSRPLAPDAVVPTLRAFFLTAGINFDEPGKSISFAPNGKALLIHANAQEFDLIAKALQVLMPAPQQLTLRVKAMEVTEDNNGHGFDWFLGNAVISNGAPIRSLSALDMPSANFVRPDYTGKTGDAIPAELLTSGLRTKTPPQPQQTVTGILNDEQFRTVIRALEQRGQSDLLSMPEVTTLSGRQVRIQITQPWTNLPSATNALPNQTLGQSNSTNETGITVDIVPYVEDDHFTIGLTVLPSVREFAGYDETSKTLPATGGPFAPQTPVPTPVPKFRLRQVPGSARVFDGQTLVLTSSTLDETGRKVKHLAFFITPRLIDPAGNPLHSDDQLPFHQKVPSQHPPATTH